MILSRHILHGQQAWVNSQMQPKEDEDYIFGDRPSDQESLIESSELINHYAAEQSLKRPTPGS
jgi:hypothetical protein